MIVVRLEGGLGNQLFQYSHGLALQAEYGGKLLLERRLIRNDPSKSHALELLADIEPQSAFDDLLVFLLGAYTGILIRALQAIFGKSKKTSDLLARFGVHHTFDSGYVELRVPRLPFLYLHGNFLSGKYFDSANDHVRASLHPERVLGNADQETISKIRSSNSVAVHVRRGDYLSDKWRDKLHVCTDEYYERAVEIVTNTLKSPTFFVFSNSAEDIEWIRENYQFLPEGAVFVPPGSTDVEHFALMAMCRHFIIANSTFSWWSSYLSQTLGKLVVAPSPWNRGSWDMTDLYSVDWNIVDLKPEENVTEAGNSGD